MVTLHTFFREFDALTNRLQLFHNKMSLVSVIISEHNSST